MISFISFLLSLIFQPVLAVDIKSTSTPTIEPTPAPTNVDEIKKIRDLVKEKLKQITNPTITKKGIIGKVTQTSNLNITIEYQNSTKELSIDDNTTYIDLKKNKTKLDKLKIGQDILVLGIDNSETNTFEAKRIIFLDPQSLVLSKTTVVGKIVDISKSSPVFTLIPSKNKNNLFQIKTDSKTILITSDKTKIKSTDLKSGQKIIAILTPDLKMSKTYYAIEIINLDFEPSPSPTPKP